MSEQGAGTGTQEPPNLPDPPDPLDWLEFVQSMKAVSEMTRQAPASPDLPHGYPASAYALHHVFNFLRKQSAFTADDLFPLRNLYADFLDIGRGRVSPLFRPTTNAKDNPGNGALLEIIKGQAARAMDELIKDGKRVEDASRIVMKSLRKLRLKEKIKAETVKNWRDRLTQGPGPGSPPAALFAFKKAYPGNSHAERAQTILKILQEEAVIPASQNRTDPRSVRPKRG